MREGEKREALLQKILGRIRQTADIVSNGWYAVASEGGEICKANFASWGILKVLRISGTLDYLQTCNCWRSYGTYPGRYGLRLYDCRIPGIPKKSVPGNSTPKMLGGISRDSKLGFGFYLPEQAVRNQFLPVQQSDTFGCAVNALKMLGFVRVPVGSKQRPESNASLYYKNLRYVKTYQQQ